MSSDKVIRFSELVLVLVELLMVLELFGVYPRTNNRYYAYDFDWYDWPYMGYLIFVLLLHFWITVNFIRELYTHPSFGNFAKLHQNYPIFTLFHILAFGRVFQMLQVEITWYQAAFIVLYRIICAIHFYRSSIEFGENNHEESFEEFPPYPTYVKPIPYEPPPPYEAPPPYSSVVIGGGGNI